ncbi:hypothetical protein D3877_08275 [Azospirillum cavernae]|uniref:Carrier domain-containing protein n=1 Tax=Azospirillum cavernae TaxID=2320860 RepID=A0A418W3A8_9PROT|nr:hypothetical protein D3877_08275 [Azospirillum cavernae]
MTILDTSQILSVIASSLGVNRAMLGAQPEIYRTIGWDSLSTLQIIEAIEIHFGVQITDEDVGQCTSLSGILNVLAKMGVKNGIS